MAEDIAANLKRIEDGIAAACARAGRRPTEVTLIAVSKRQPAEALRAALAAGQLDLGESYAQELRDKARELTADTPPGPRWHFIGPLQRNKVKYVVGTAALVHTVDSRPLLEAMEQRAAGLELTQPVLVQVNLAHEPQKSGAAREDLALLLDAFATAPHLRCEGLMLMPPWDPEPEAGRPLFAALRRLRDELAATPRPGVALAHLSMGMSHDYAVAIEEGATLVRVGTAIFGER
jgi:pyridoxal phosphate enzyme (YggS family)